MKGNARKYLSLMLTASMVLGSFGTTAFATNTKATTGYISVDQAIADTTGRVTTPASLSLTTAGAIFTNPEGTIGIESEQNHTIIKVGTNKSEFTTSTSAAMALDFANEDITVKATAATVNMSGGTIGALKFETPTARTFSTRAAGNSVTVSGGEVKTDITGASTVTVNTGAIVTGKIEATESVEVKGGTVGSVDTKTATIAGGTVNAVKATEKVDVTGGTAKAVESPTVTVANGAKVDGVTNVENLKVESGATITGTITTAANKDVVIDIDKDATATGTTITVPSSSTGSVSVKVPTGTTITGDVDNKEIIDTSGKVEAQKATVEYYDSDKTTSLDTITYEAGNTTNPITNNEITLPTTIGGKTVVSWDYFIIDTTAAAKPEGIEANTAAGQKVDITKLVKPIKMVANYGTTPVPDTIDVSFEYYNGTTTTSSAITVPLTKDANSDVHFPDYTDAALNNQTAGTLKTPANQEFYGWAKKPAVATTPVTEADVLAVNGTAGNIIADTGATYVPYFVAQGSVKTITATFKYFKTGDTTTPTGTKAISFKENVTAPNFPAYTGGDLGSDFKALTADQVFEGWVVSGSTTLNKAGAPIPKTNATYEPKITDNSTPSGNTIKVELYRINSDTTAQKTVDIEYTLVNGNKVFKAPANEFSYSGKTFDSWSTNFDKAYYYPGKDVTVPAGTPEPVKLYAYWTNKSSSGGGGGGGSSSSSTKYTVTASAGKGGSISPSGDVQVTKGNDKTFKITADKGYVISDVLVDGDSVGAVKSYTIKNIKNDMTIKAVFETEDGKPAEEDPENPSDNTDNNKGTFTDTRGHWAEKYINTVVEKGLFSGMTDTTFGPDVAMTRAMFVTVLGRMSNVNTTSYSSSKFSDVPADSWFGPYVNWAAQQGIVSGLTSTTFGPNDPITREQMAVILVNYAKVAGVVLPTVNDPMMFSDNSNISGWAKDAVATAQKAGLINGRTNGSFDPQGKATRAEVATVFVQLDSLTGGSKAAATDTAAEETETTETEETTEE